MVVLGLRTAAGVDLAEVEARKENPVGDGYLVVTWDEGFAKHHPEVIADLKPYNATVKAEAATAGVEPEEKHLLGYKYDSAFALLIKKLIPPGTGLQGFMLAAILGAVISSLASMLNSASTIFTMDIYRKYMKKDASQGNLVAVGRICTVVFVVIGCLISPILADPEFGGIFKYIQEFQGYISPGILAVFVFGLLVRRAPPVTGVVGLLLNAPLYFLLKTLIPSMAFLDRMALTFTCVLIVMGIITMIKPLDKAKELPTNTDINLESSSAAKVLGLIVVTLTVTLYIIFW